MSLLQRARLSEGRRRWLWLLAAGLTFGGGTWATHFVAILAYRSAVPIGVDFLLTIVSAALAVIVATVGWALAFKPGRPVVGAAVAGLGACGMHYTGMLALAGPFQLQFDWTYVVASILLGVGFAVGAGLAATRIRNVWGRSIGAFLLCLAVLSLHFTGMTGLTLVPDGRSFSALSDDRTALTTAIVAISFLTLALGLASSAIDRQLALRASREAERLRSYIVELELAHRDLGRTSQELRGALARAAIADGAKAQFLATMSHELRTPLNAIIGFAEMMLEAPFGPLDPKYQEYSGDIASSGRHLLALINDVLDLARFDSVGASLSMEPFDLVEVVESAVATLAASAEAAKIKLTWAPPNTEFTVNGEPRRVQQILGNIISNAIKFTRPGGEVSVVLDREEARARVVIRDNGIGMSVEEIEKALSPFGQVDGSLARKFEGAGIGLPLAKRLVEMHGGRLTIDSSPREGTAVSVEFPTEVGARLERAA